MLNYVKLSAYRWIFAYINYMILGTKKVGTLIALIVVSLAGLIFLQGLLLRDAIKSREQTFNNNVATALNSAIDLIEVHQAVSVIIDVAGDLDDLDSMTITVDADDSSMADTVRSKLILFKADTVITREGCFDSTIFSTCIQNGTLDSINLLDKRRRNDIEIFKTEKHKFKTGSDSSASSIKIFGAITDSRVDFMQRVLSQMWVSESVPVESRIDSALIDSSLTRSLAEVNVYLDYVFGISLSKPDSLIIAPAKFEDELIATGYRTRLFPLDILSPDTELLLYFPDRQVYLWKQILPMLAIIGIFLLIIITTFIYTIKVILMQKRNAALMADFVNNMTHEFKTPISTITLATEAILREDMISDNEKVRQFSKMIQDENKRMRNQAEKILHMASMENGDIKLNLDSIDIHEVIKEAVDNISLSVAKRSGAVAFENKADNPVISSDKVHLSGIINNLLDNALKYSPEYPKINISTLNADGGIYIRISDKGIGISKSDLKMVFNKYYRVSSGDVHDVKGFGLGLSYVKLMVEAHKGKVEIKSQPGKGTRVELYFPQKD